MRRRDGKPPKLDSPILLHGSLVGAHFTWDDRVGDQPGGKGMWIVRAEEEEHPKVKSWKASQPPGTIFHAYISAEFESIAKEAIYR